MNVKVNEKIKFVPTIVEPERYSSGTLFLVESGTKTVMLIETNDYPILIDLNNGDVYATLEDTDYDMPTPQQFDEVVGGSWMELKGKVTLTICVEDEPV